MQFTLSDLPKVELPGVLYSLELYFEPTDKDIIALENALKYAQKKYDHISWFVAVSDTESSSAIKYSEKQGKRGRPKTKVDGVKTKRHIHTGVMGNKEKSSYTVIKNIAVKMNKRVGKKVTKVKAMKGAGFIGYAYKQANTFHCGGDFDFKQCKDDFYIDVG
jgi:hypothetical protein